MIKTIHRFLARTLVRKKSMIIVSEQKIQRMISGKGFRLLQIQPEGIISVRSDQEPPPRVLIPHPTTDSSQLLKILAEKVK